MRRVKRRIWSGAVLEQEIYPVSDKQCKPADAKPKLRFRDEEQRAMHRDRQALREFTRWLNTNFDETCLYVTLTCDVEHELEDFDAARRARACFARRLSRMFQNAIFCIFMGRGNKTERIHLHMCIKGVSADADELRRIIRKRYKIDYEAEQAARNWKNEQEALLTLVWGGGKNARVEPMRKRNMVNGKMVGRDYSALALYLWRHWTQEQGGQHCYKTRNGQKADREDAAECKTKYSKERPPRLPKAPEGYEYVLADYIETDYGYQNFRWVLTPKGGKLRAEGAYI